MAVWLQNNGIEVIPNVRFGDERTFSFCFNGIEKNKTVAVGTPRNNKAQNKQANSVSKKLKLTPKQQRELHDLIHGQNWGYQEILDNAKEWFNKYEG